MNLTKPLQATLEQEIKKRKLPDNFIETVQRWYLPVAQQINESFQQKQGTLLVSFNGAQGSGKSTITAFLRLILIQQFGLNTVEISIDDFYKTQQQRVELSNEVHPLFITRGVPGTHDLELAATTIKCLQKCSEQQSCKLPRFDKASDDRSPESDWSTVDEPVDIILFEGWCNHAPVQSEQQLQQPVNELERDEDADAVWRSYANAQLAEYHSQLFSQADLLIYLQVPSFEKVYEWRGLQEKKLVNENNANTHGVMDEQQLQRFIQHYERITRECLQHLPALADIVLKLNAQHGIESISLAGDEAVNV